MLSERYLPDQGKITQEMISRVSDTAEMYQVESESTAGQLYDVDMVHGMCTCAVGFNGAPCKHQYAVTKHFQVNSFNFFPLTDENIRQHLFYLASGLESGQLPRNWFCPLGAGCGPELDEREQAPFDIVPTMDLQGQADIDTNMTGSAIESLNAQRQLQNMFDRRHCAGARHSRNRDAAGSEKTNTDIEAILDGIQRTTDNFEEHGYA